MRLNFTDRRKIERQHVTVRLLTEANAHFFEVSVAFQHYPALPPDGRVFIEAYRKFVLMRFDLGHVAQLKQLGRAERRLSDFDHADGIKFRLKVTQADGTESGKLLAEADGLRPENASEGRVSLIQVEGASDLGQTPWELELEPTDADLPTLRINESIGGKLLGYDPTFRSLVLPAVVREVFTQLIRNGAQDDDPNHWLNLWTRFATEVLQMSDPTQISSEMSDEGKEWLREASSRFCENRRYVDRYLSVHSEGGAQ